jgi:uncharacterized membrane protein YuzA (DUF378 family)
VTDILCIKPTAHCFSIGYLNLFLITSLQSLYDLVRFIFGGWIQPVEVLFCMANSLVELLDIFENEPACIVSFEVLKKVFGFPLLSSSFYVLPLKR